MLIPQPSYRVFSGLPPKTHWAPAGVSRRGPSQFLAPLWRGAVCAADRGARASGSHGRGRAASFGLAVGAGREWSRAWVSWVCGEVPVPVRVRAGAGFGYGKAPWGVCSEGLPVRVVRRRATLPHPVGCSTIAVPGLSFRVRNGTGRLTWAMAAANLLLYGQTLGSAGLWRPGNRTADADMSMFRLVARQCSLPSGAVCRRKMRSNRQGLEC